MVKRSTYTIISEEGDAVDIEFYVTDDPMRQGMWDVMSNQVLLTPAMYNEWRLLIGGTRQAQKKFFDGLQQVITIQLKRQNYGHDNNKIGPGDN